MLQLLVGQRELQALVHDMLQKFTRELTAAFLADRPGEHHGHQAMAGAKRLGAAGEFLGGGRVQELYVGGVGVLRLLIPLQTWRARRGQERGKLQTQRPKPAFSSR